ncbi:MBL fold metallo-hydrolase [Brevibacillus fluminis]|uniref:MBL fold metallo-hydrolase n=1 Tax=Brevibacillus fluminis TaxID=511487 RepID=UPI003F8A761D
MKTFVLPVNGTYAQDQSVTVFTSCLWQTTSTVVETPERLFVFDPAYFPHELEAIAAFVSSIRKGRPIILVLTHGDWDHIAGFSAFADATVVAQKQILAEGRLQDQLGKVLSFDERYYVDRKQAGLLPRIDRAIDGDELVDLWGVRFLPVPGHTKDMMATLFVEQKLLVMGDMLSDREFPFINDSIAYTDSLAKIGRLAVAGDIQLLVPGHGAPAGADEIVERIRCDQAYIEEGRRIVREGRQNGWDKEETKAKFLGMTYREQPIAKGIADMHAGNFEVFWEEDVLSNQ